MTQVQQEVIFIPMVFMVCLTLMVWIYMYYTRITYLFANKIDPQRLSPTEDGKQILKDVSGPSENLINLFEMPVLFYGAVLTTYVLGLVDSAYVVLASSYVFLRYVHSYIHCTYNQVKQRFFVYIISSLLLWVYWLLLAKDLIQKVN